MIKNRAVADEVSKLMLELTARLNESIAKVKDNCDEEDFKIYRRAVGKVMGEILLEVLNPLYEDHPSIKPPELF